MTKRNDKAVENAISAGDWTKAERLARALTVTSPGTVSGWRWLGVVMQATGRVEAAFEAFERALHLAPDDIGTAAALAQIATQAGLGEAALTLARHVAVHRPNDIHAAISLSDALLVLGRVDDAAAEVSSALQRAPQSLDLFHAAARVRRAQGGLDDAVALLSAVREARPNDVRVAYDLAWTLAERGNLSESLSLCQTALSVPSEPAVRSTIQFLEATVLLALGQLREGWKAYAVRNAVALPSAPIFDIPLARWNGQTDLAGESLLVMAEQGLGDEIAFLGLIGDLQDAIGPSGILTLSTDPRLTPLIQRRWPEVRFVPYQTQSLQGRRTRRLAVPSVEASVWAPLGDFLAHFRPTVASFASVKPYLAPDPGRVEHWRGWLASLPNRLRVGITWRSGKMLGERSRNFARLDDWAPVLSARSDVGFVALQYGQTDEELSALEGLTCARVFTPPGLDLFQNLDDLAALACALDLTIGFSNATTSLVGAIGAPLWLITPPAPWPTLGSDAYPWYSQARRFTADHMGEWVPVMRRIADALRALDA